MLSQVNAARRREVKGLRDTIQRQRASDFPSAQGYPLALLSELVTAVVRERSNRPDLVPELEIIGRQKFDADVAVKLPALLKEAGARDYMTTHIPWLVEALRSQALSHAVATVSSKGIYVNVTLTDAWFATAVQRVNELADRFGANDGNAGRTIVIDYSSPNVAKVLHAGHFRSTMIGHVLGNLHQACGALVYRVNHINDFGGFGFMLEGYRRFSEYFPSAMSENDRLLEIYAIRRALERVVGSGQGLADATSGDTSIISRYFPAVRTHAGLLAAYRDFVASSDARFAKLEEGDPDEVTLWSRMVDWSLTEFRFFYEALDIHLDFTIGESFYLQAGNAVIDEALRAGRATTFTEELAQKEIGRLDRAAAAGEITAAVRDKAAELVRKDLGAVVVLLPGHERLVVRRSDGRSIYATRDVGAIKLRREIFNPTDSYYVVGQEQRVHFARLFQAAEVLGLVNDGDVHLSHVSFGFYVDEATGRKLSSRDSVAGVNELLKASFDHFRKKSAERGTMSEEELDVAAQQLAVGSLVFNDLKRDMKAPVSMARGDLHPTLTAFEKSGGPYVVYTACRARAILRRYGKPVPRLTELATFEINNQEAILILTIQELPEKIIRAAAEENPSILVRYLLDLAVLYNAYYTTSPVLEGATAHSSRLMITQAVQYALVNGLRLCHVECPPKI
jgi:arginyl-tRNA synthetase